ncbi:hypothetical protein glysoja_043642, partial [Glycine soja]
STNKPPLFRGIKYHYWNERMISYFESIHIDLWDMVENGDYVPYDDQLNELSRGQWTEEQNLRFLINSKTQNVMLCALSEEECTKVHNFRSAKQMWDILAITYKGMSQVKKNKLNLLTHNYELFSMEKGKDIQSMFGRFRTILNELRSLGRIYDNDDHIDKILRSLSRKWRLQVTTLRAIKNHDSTSLEELISTLNVHEQELQQDE